MFLLELNREEMLDLTQDFSQARYDRKKGYTSKIQHKVGPQEYHTTGNFSLLLKVGDYQVILELFDLKKYVDEMYPEGIPGRNSAQNLLIGAIDTLDLGVFCTCADFKYRFHYVATEWDSMPTGIKGQATPAKITNPGEEGMLCKHLTAVLVTLSDWIPKAVTLLRESISFDRGGKDYVS